jgi:hypothetical protein
LWQRPWLWLPLWLWLWLRFGVWFGVWFWLLIGDIRGRRGLRLGPKRNCADGVFKYEALLSACRPHSGPVFITRIDNGELFAAFQVG